MCGEIITKKSRAKIQGKSLPKISDKNIRENQQQKSRAKLCPRFFAREKNLGQRSRAKKKTMQGVTKGL